MANLTPVSLWPPVEGYYTLRLVRGGPMVPVRVWFGQPIIDGEEQDRSPRWCAELDGRTDTFEYDDSGYSCAIPLDAERVWPWCAKYPITEAQYRYMRDYAAWAKAHAPDKPQASPRSAVNVKAAKSVLP